MAEFINYALKSVLGLGIFALIYRFVYLKEINFISRRMYLLISVGLSFLLPLGSFGFVLGENSRPVNSVILNEITVYSNGLHSIESHSAFPYRKIIILIYLTVVSVLIIRLLYQLLRVFIQTRRLSSIVHRNLRVYRIPLKNTSFSFFRHVFIGETPGVDDLEKILAHEKVHALQWHSFDVLIMEILSIVFWFNPLIWWYRTEVKNVHEYLADNGALDEGINLRSYQITLLEHLIGSASISITNNFNYSLIKNRIAMMNIEKTARKNRWKIFLLMPVSILLVIAFACTEKPESTDSPKEVNSQELYYETAYSEVDIMPEFEGGFDGIRKFIAQNVAYPAGARENGVAGKVFVQFVVNKEGKIVTKLEEFRLEGNEKIIDEIVVTAFEPAEGNPQGDNEKYIQELKDEAIRVISLLPSFEKPAMKNGKAVAISLTIPITFALK